MKHITLGKCFVLQLSDYEMAPKYMLFVLKSQVVFKLPHNNNFKTKTCLSIFFSNYTIHWVFLLNIANFIPSFPRHVPISSEPSRLEKYLANQKNFPTM